MMNTAPINDTRMDTDFYLTASADYPLLSAAQEQSIDRLKWAAARRCLRLVLADAHGRELLAEFCRACRDRPLLVESFSPRSLFFTLRKDIAPYLGDSSEQLAPLLTLLEDSREDRAALRAAINALDWPATLMTGLAILHLRRQGLRLPDLLADAMVIWQPGWGRGYRSGDTTAVRNVAAIRRLRRALRRYLAARDRLVMHNLRLVHRLAWDHPDRGIAKRDLVQEGIIGLIRAAEKYEFRRGFRFTTYAYPWINQHLQRATENRGSLVSYPSHVMAEINQLHRARLQYQEETGRDPGAAVLAERSGMQVDKVNQLRALTNITLSINHPEAEDTESQLAANIADPDSDRAQRSAENSSLRKLLWQRIGTLEEREQAVLTGRWGLDGRPQRTFAQLADQLAVSREWVRQLEKNALQKLAAEAELGEAYEEILA